MPYQRCYAYGVHVRGQKKFGGIVHADSMEEAVRRVVALDGITLKRLEPCLRPFDGALINQAKWMLGEDEAMIYVWAPPEYF